MIFLLCDTGMFCASMESLIIGNLDTEQKHLAFKEL